MKALVELQINDQDVQGGSPESVMAAVIAAINARANLELATPITAIDVLATANDDQDWADTTGYKDLKTRKGSKSAR